MSTSKTHSRAWADKRVLIVGLGGLGCPAALALARAGVGSLVLLDEDRIDASNLHRQILYDARDLGGDKVETAARRLRKEAGATTHIEARRGRLLPDSARALVGSVDVVVEGADNFATKFLTADACHLEGKPVVHGAAIRWRATAWAVSRAGQPCYRCLFEDLPPIGAQVGCAEAGVVGPVVGFTGALLADLALRVLADDPGAYGVIHTYDGLRDQLRSVALSPRPGCALCGRAPTILDTSESRYLAEHHAA